MWIVVYGDIFDGLQGAVGPFEGEGAAVVYLEYHNLGHYVKAKFELEAPKPK